MSTLFIAGYAFMKQGDCSVFTGLHPERSISAVSEKELMEQMSLTNLRFPRLNRCGFRTKQVLFCGAAVLRDANTETLPSGTGIITIGKEGAFQENLLYWNDYCQFGKESARGHLFVGTLPTTPASTLAIALDIHGPVWYFDPHDFFPDLQREIDAFAEEQPDTPLLLAFPDGEKTMLFLLSPEKGIPLTELKGLLP